MRSETPPWERREQTHREREPVTTYWLHLGDDRYPIPKRPIARALSEAGATITAVTEGRR